MVKNHLYWVNHIEANKNIYDKKNPHNILNINFVQPDNVSQRAFGAILGRHGATRLSSPRHPIRS